MTLEVADQTVLTAVDLHENWTWLLRTVRQALEPISPTGQLVNTDARNKPFWLPPTYDGDEPR
ncbi:hypothetical protein KFU94_08765 [Chloroflexi bacterium TSY]|nr:hypothetical protein [Chloroflexi bacterium TSY]